MYLPFVLYGGRNMSESIQAIKAYIEKHGYTYTVGSIFRTYREYYKPGWYCSYTANLVIKNNLHHFKVIDNYMRRKNR